MMTAVCCKIADQQASGTAKCDRGVTGYSEEGRDEGVGSTGGCESQTAGAAAGDHLQLHHSIFCALFVSKPPLFSSVSWHLDDI